MALDQRVIRKRGYVALLDVLGFRDLIARETASEEVERYVEAISEAVANQGERVLQYVLFSDSVVLYSIEDGEHALEAIVAACSNIMHSLVSRGVAVRGAIAHGNFIRSFGLEAGAIVAGSPIVEAFEYEKRQNWLGIMLCPSVLRANPELETRLGQPTREQDEGWAAWFLRCRLALMIHHWTTIPFHGSFDVPTAHDGFAVVPLRADAQTRTGVVDSIQETMAAARKLRFEAPDPVAQGKYRDALRFLEAAQHFRERSDEW
jgi:hypothetical protein